MLPGAHAPRQGWKNPSLDLPRRNQGRGRGAEKKLGGATMAPAGARREGGRDEGREHQVDVHNRKL